jgi:thiol:disulfide interchange protein
MLSVPILVSRRFLFLGSLLCGMAAIAFSDTAPKVSTIPEVITDDYSTLWVLLGLVLASMATWVYGRWGGFGISSQTRRKAWFVSFSLLASGVWLGYPTEKGDLDGLQWEKWTPARERELQDAGQAVYVDYTAKWCWSCQVNKRVFHYEDVIRKIRELDIVLLKADWTDKNPVILNALQSYGREGVPLNIYHKAHDPKALPPPPILMPEALTEAMVLDVLETGKPYLEPGEQGFVAILGFAFLGGLILNLMPCVFPVLGLKIMGFVKQAGEDRKKIARHGFIFTAGVLISFWLLVGILLWLRNTMKQELGWGFQLQEPGFVFILALVLLIFALSLSGVFEIGQSLIGTGSQLSRQSGYAGSFFSGVLAVVVATPCMAPFLGVAVGAALAMAWVPAIAVFTCVGLGLAFPYLLLSLMPNWISRLPKPGAWMESFKQAMAFPIYATVVWLVWNLSAQLG